MRELSIKDVALAALFGLPLLLAGCGDQEDAAQTNNASTPLATVNQFTIGNDASAVETVNSNAAEAPDLLSLGNGSAVINASSDNSAAPADDGAERRNRVESNVSGM